MKIYVIAGEASGDNHAHGVLSELQAIHPEITVRGLGGPQLAELTAGGVENWIDQAAVVGLWDVLVHYPWFRKKFAQARREVTLFQPDLILLVDYPGFNLRFAKACHQLALRAKVAYYISPQVWAWNRARIPKMAQWIDVMMCIFPFEAEIYAQSGLRAVFTGHPIRQHLEPYRVTTPRNPQQVALLPGSRRREVERIFPPMVEAAQLLHQQHPEWKFTAAAANDKTYQLMQNIAQHTDFIKVQRGGAYELMQTAHAGLVASGTATLEAAYFQLPYSLVYRVNPLTYAIGKKLIRVPYLGIVNILANELVVNELIQENATAEKCAAALEALMSGQNAVNQPKIQAIIDSLDSQKAYSRAAQEIHQLVPSAVPHRATKKE